MKPKAQPNNHHTKTFAYLVTGNVVRVWRIMKNKPEFVEERDNQGTIDGKQTAREIISTYNNDKKYNLFPLEAD